MLTQEWLWPERTPDDARHDLSYRHVPEVSWNTSLRLVTTNPRPVWLVDSKNARSQLRYQSNARTERMIRWTLRFLLGERGLCRDAGGEVPPLALDVGANEGMYTLLMAAYGCRVVSWEPQPACMRPLIVSVAVNAFEHSPRLLNKVASSDPTAVFKVHRHGRCRGDHSFKDNIRMSNASKPRTDDVVAVGSTSVDAAVSAEEADAGVRTRIAVLHIDVEGAEISVLRSALTHIPLVDNLFVEVNVGRWKNFGVTTDEGASLIEQVVASGGLACRDLNAAQASHPLNLPVITNLTEHIHSLDRETDMWCTSLSDLKTRPTPDAPALPFAVRGFVPLTRAKDTKETVVVFGIEDE